MADPEHIPDNTSTDAGPERSGEQVRDRVIRLAFDGDRERYALFIRTLRESIPPDVTVILRGSAVTGHRWHTDIPFDADGPGTSDLDLTMVSRDMVKLFDVHYIPGMHTAPLSDAHPDASATLHPLRSALCSIARRPVNIQATSNLLQFVRDIVMNQPYFTMIDPNRPDAEGR